MTETPDPEDHSNPASMRNPPLIVRLLFAHLINRLIDPQRMAARRQKVERQRRQRQQPHVIAYFHQTDDPYSHLAVQVLGQLQERYNVVIKPHLIRAARGKNQPRYDDLTVWARRDVGLIAGPYGLSFPEEAGVVPPSDLVTAAEQALAAVKPEDFSSVAPKISEALWAHDQAALDSFEKASSGETESLIEEGSQHLKKLGHYSGAMLHYGKEWYWGVDRLDHLEAHLRENQAQTSAAQGLIVQRPEPDVSGIDASGITLHFYPSLNSPYTAICYDQVIALREQCGVNLITKPVLPMIMRGVPATMDKIRYIMLDTKREGDKNGVPFGPLLSPIGRPVLDAYSLFPWAKTKGLDERLLGELLRRAFSQAAPLHREAGMKAGVEAAGLNWDEAKTVMGSEEWRAVTAGYQAEMTEGMRLWGVPSFRVEGPGDEPGLDIWGQDRVWLIAEEIKRRAALATDRDTTR